MTTSACVFTPVFGEVSTHGAMTQPEADGRNDGNRRALRSLGMSKLALSGMCNIIITDGVAKLALEENNGAYSARQPIPLLAHIIRQSGNTLLLQHDSRNDDETEDDSALSPDLFGYFTAVIDAARREMRFHPKAAPLKLYDEEGLSHNPQKTMTLIGQTIAEERLRDSVPYIFALKGEATPDGQSKEATRFLLEEDKCLNQLAAVLRMFCEELGMSERKRESIEELDRWLAQNYENWSPVKILPQSSAR